MNLGFLLVAPIYDGNVADALHEVCSAGFAKLIYQPVTCRAIAEFDFDLQQLVSQQGLLEFVMQGGGNAALPDADHGFQRVREAA